MFYSDLLHFPHVYDPVEQIPSHGQGRPANLFHRSCICVRTAQFSRLFFQVIKKLVQIILINLCSRSLDVWSGSFEMLILLTKFRIHPSPGMLFLNLFDFIPFFSTISFTISCSSITPIGHPHSAARSTNWVALLILQHVSQSRDPAVLIWQHYLIMFIILEVLIYLMLDCSNLFPTIPYYTTRHFIFTVPHATLLEDKHLSQNEQGTSKIMGINVFGHQ